MSGFTPNAMKIDNKDSKLLFHRNSIFLKPFNLVLVTVLNIFLVNSPNIQIVQAETTLTANDVIRMDIAPRLYTLKDVLFILKSFPDYISQKDYTTVRNLLRQGQPSSLRVTCRKIIQYLPSKTEQAEFKAAYASMIDALDDFDTVRSYIDMFSLHN